MSIKEWVDKNANNEISELIEDLKILIKKNALIIKYIKYPILLIRNLNELKKMIEIVEIKNAIVAQIKFILTNNIRKKETVEDYGFEGHMLHCVISGPPGTGKTTIAKILGKIWASIGIIKKKEEKKSGSELGLDIEKINKILNYNKNIKNGARKLIKNSVGKSEEINKILDNSNNITGILDDYKINRNIKKDIPNFINKKKKSKTPEPTRRSKNNLFYKLDEEPLFVIVTRVDLIAEYIGQTAPKTLNILNKARGGVLLIDEAYSICNIDGLSHDKFGEECLTTINEFMSKYPEEIIIIFAGYKDKLFKTIFKVQPGLQRRCTWFFDIKKYTYIGLSRIFIKQLEKDSWILSPDIDIFSIFKKYQNILIDSGGSTEKLVLFCKIEYGKSKFNECINNDDDKIHNSIITMSMLNNAISYYELQINDIFIIFLIFSNFLNFLNFSFFLIF